MCKCNAAVRTPFCGKPGCEWPVQATVDGQPKIVKENRAIATKFAQDIADYANKQEKAGQVAMMIGCLVHQNIVLSMLAQLFDIGSPEGFAEIETFYEAAKMDALARWADDRFLVEFRKRFLESQNRFNNDPNVN